MKRGLGCVLMRRARGDLIGLLLCGVIWGEISETPFMRVLSWNPGYESSFPSLRVPCLGNCQICELEFRNEVPSERDRELVCASEDIVLCLAMSFYHVVIPL